MADAGETNPLSRSTPLGGRTGVAIASLTPIVALVLFLIFGFLGGWAWSWVFFLLVPTVFIAIYGMRTPRSHGR